MSTRLHSVWSEAPRPPTTAAAAHPTDCRLCLLEEGKATPEIALRYYQEYLCPLVCTEFKSDSGIKLCGEEEANTDFGLLAIITYG